MTALGKSGSTIRKIFEYSKIRKSEIGDENVYDFSLGNPSVPPPKGFDDRLNSLIYENRLTVHGYTSSQGDFGVRKAIADAYTAESGVEVSPDYIYMTCGAAASLTITLNAISCPGDEVILLAPFFPEYSVFVTKAGAKPVIVRTTPHEFRIDTDALSAAISENTKAIIVNSPNNPTGVVYSDGEIKALSDLLLSKQQEYGHDIYLISDDPYRKLVYGDVRVPYAMKYYDNTIVCYSFSKALSLPGERIGYIALSPKASNVKDLFAAVCGAGRALGYVCAPSLFQYAITDFLDTTSDTSVYEENRRILTKSLAEIGYESASPDGAFYLFIRALEDDANAFCEKAKEFELLLVPSDDFGCSGYVRLAYCTDTEHVRNSLPAFEKLYKAYNP